MTETVNSKFYSTIWLTAFLYGILIFFLIVICVGLAGNKNYRGELIFILALAVILSGFYIQRAFKRLIKVAVTPDALILNYLISEKKVTIQHADILHESVIRERETHTGGRVIVSDIVKLKIKLNTGKNFYLYEDYYENFDELAEAIRRARFKLE